MHVWLTSSIRHHLCCVKVNKIPFDLLCRKTLDFISPQLWPPNNPDLNPVDYHIWCILEQRVYRTRIRDVNHLMTRLVEEWQMFDQKIIDWAFKHVASTSSDMRSRTRRTLWTSAVAWTWLTACHCTLLETSHFECCVLNVHKIGNVVYISIKIIISCWFALLIICLKFQTNLTSFLLHYSNFFRGPLFIGTQCRCEENFTRSTTNADAWSVCGS